MLRGSIYLYTCTVVARDSLSKAIYDRLFRWIVNRTNALLAPSKDALAGESEIGILDIFGFEKFNSNSFEQLNINVANEQLQFFFNEHIFALELEEYRREGIDTADVKYKDNQPVLVSIFKSKYRKFIVQRLYKVYDEI